MDSLRKPTTIKPPTFTAREVEYFPDVSFPNHIPVDSPALTPKKFSSHRGRKIFFGILILFFLTVGAGIFFFFYKSLSVGRSIQIQNTDTSLLADMKRLAVSYFKKQHNPLQGENTGRVNILLLGRAGEHYPGKNLTDTVIMMSIDTENKKVALLSLPRDLYAPIPHTNLYTKINSIYQYGLSQNINAAPLRESVEEITGQKINYFFVLDFDGFEKTVDALGGITVDVLRDFYDPSYPGKNYSYETFAIKKGWQKLDGATALKYVRERHNDPEGDFGRAKRQQQVIQAIKDKAFSLGTFFNIFAVNSLLNALGKSVQTDMTLDEMESFLRLTKTLDTENVSSIVINAWQKESLLRVSHIQVGPVAAFILVPRVGNWSEINDVSENIFQLDALKIRREKIKGEQPTLTLLYAPEDIALAEKMKRLITEMSFATVSVIPAPALKNSVKQSMIVNSNGFRKPFSLDELIKKFALKPETTLPFALSVSDISDFTIIIGADLADKLSFDEESNTTNENDTPFSEWLAPQMKKNR
jgi:LCP family protein required for cell wall assembly